VDLRASNITVLLPLLHEARGKDEKAFWINLFLPWISIQSSVRVNRDRIPDEFARIADFKPGSRELLVHLVNIYRNIVSDLLDPYMTLLVACFQFIEGEFTSLKNANVGLGERNKAKYLESRIKNEADVRLDRNKISISVDFDSVAELERNSLDRQFSRKERP
jgi:hypothetical protein